MRVAQMQIARCIALAGFLLTGAFAQEARSQDAADEERQVFYALFECLHAAAKKLDDKISDAASVAVALKPLCTAEFVKSRELGGRRLNPAARNIYHQNDSAAFIQVATMVVLDERRKRR